MGRPGQPDPRDLREVEGLVRGSLGLDDADRLVRALASLSKRLWQEPQREVPDARRRRATFRTAAPEAELGAALRVLTAHRNRVDPWPADRLATLDHPREYGPRWEATAVLVTGALAFGVADQVPLRDLDGLFDTVLHVAFGDDDQTVAARRAILVGAGDPWPPPLPGDDWPDFGADCLLDLRAAGARLATSVATSRTAEANAAAVDANGIASLSPSVGSSGDAVAIVGSFPATERTVLFPRAGGGTAAATLVTWSAARIDVVAPEPVGDGPVGFLDTPDVVNGLDPTASSEFADAVANCLGVPLGPTAGRLSGLAPDGVAVRRADVPRLAGDVNVFHGGPVLVSVAPARGAEPGPPVTVTGLNLAPGDTASVGGLAAPSTVVDTATMTFTPPDLRAGEHLLQIARGAHRSNAVPFDVRASLDATPPTGRLRPGTDARLSGTGFGPTITASLDGVPAAVTVADTHTLDVRITRPRRTPRVADIRGEKVVVEVFDRGVALGTIDVLLDTVRIAALGDSVMWGQGLLESQKFTTLVADALTQRYLGEIAVYALDRCAHSGARIAPSAGDAPDSAAPRPPGDFSGECPSPVPSVTAQVAGWASAALAPQRGEIDLVLLDGGINDVGVQTILDPFASDAALAAGTRTACLTGMSALLAAVHASFPSASVVVTGYFPIVTDRSDLAFLLPALSGLGLLGTLVVPLVPGASPVGLDPASTAALTLWLRRRLIERSMLFCTVANASLAAAVAAAGPMTALAVPAYGPTNAIFAPDAWLFGVGLSTAGLVPLDPVAASRLVACGAGDPITNVASIGHPNAAGARAYADAVIETFPAMGL